MNEKEELLEITRSIYNKRNPYGRLVNNLIMRTKECYWDRDKCIYWKCNGRIIFKKDEANKLFCFNLQYLEDIYLSEFDKIWNNGDENSYHTIWKKFHHQLFRTFKVEDYEIKKYII
jgi:hypothetical protein